MAGRERLLGCALLAARAEQPVPRGASRREPLLLRQRRAARRARPRAPPRSWAAAAAALGRPRRRLARRRPCSSALGLGARARADGHRRDAARSGRSSTPTSLAWRPSAVAALVAGLRRRARSTRRVRRGAAAAARGRAALLALATPLARAVADLDPPQHVIANPALPPLTMDGEGQGARGPFFPSSGETNVGGPVPSNFFMKSEDCARCHKDIYDQWNASAHHFASFNNQWYRKSIEYMQDVVGTKPSKWCAGCHDHAVFFAGKFDTPDQAADRHARGAGRPRLHVLPLDRARQEHDGAGRLHDRVPAAARPRGEREPAAAGEPRLPAEARPGPARAHVPEALPHRSRRRSSAPRATRCTSTCRSTPTAGCAASTSTTTGRPPASRARARAPSTTRAKPQTCADCHMPLVPSKDPAARDGKVHSHRFPGANTALPFVNGDKRPARADARRS